MGSVNVEGRQFEHFR